MRDGGFVMFEKTSELAENKLLILYILNKIKVPISNNQLTEMVLENNLMNYFTLQQYISELDDSNFSQYQEQMNKNLLLITEKGENVLSIFKDRISPLKINLLDDYIAKKIDSIKKELIIQSDYTPSNNDNFIVELNAFEDDSILIDLKVSVPSKKHAVALCSNWKNNYSFIYNKIINILLADKNEEPEIKKIK